MEYSIDFSERLIEAADSFIGKTEPECETNRAVLYLSLVSCEVSLKYALEKAGFAANSLRTRSHNFSALLSDFCKCKIWNSDVNRWESAIAIASVVVVSEVRGVEICNGTIGSLLDHDNENISKFPNSIRYGDKINHYDPLVMLDCAKAVAKWVRKNESVIHRKL